MCISVEGRGWDPRPEELKEEVTGRHDTTGLTGESLSVGCGTVVGIDKVEGFELVGGDWCRRTGGSYEQVYEDGVFQRVRRRGLGGRREVNGGIGRT